MPNGFTPPFQGSFLGMKYIFSIIMSALRAFGDVPNLFVKAK